ncbi:exonuclease SbcCD subunit D [[Clostridium] dakarense]|uniref:exonuclease SbcCD subunit D n=1 Tax=Faecalimicrobium dakarense TaxID=1301100 RepID=UPI0004B98580|nr:exonuclease SbcCD subunit D [[Clostridium] dakarense]
MKLFHLGDLHIGKVVNGFSMIEDQEFVLKQVKDKIKEYKPDALVLAGDIYDRSVPPAKAISLFNEFLSDVLLELKTPILAIAGNHDGADLIGFGKEIFEKTGLYIEGNFSRNIKKISLKDEYGHVNFYLVPFADYAVVRDELDNKEIKSLNDAMKAIIHEINKEININERNILVTHAYVTGGENPETSDSEKMLVVGGKEYVESSLFDNFDYVALGHLHRCQGIGGNRIRYSGSLLKYSFSEENYNKSITMIDIDKNKEIKCELLPLTPIRDMKTLEGNLEDLLENIDESIKNDYIRVILTDQGELIEPMSKLRQVYPNVMLLEIKRIIGNMTQSPLTSSERQSKSMDEIFSDFYRYHMKNDLSEEGMKILNKVIKEVKGEEF